MYAKYGNYVHYANLLRVTQTATYVYTARGQKMMLDVMASVQGALPIESPADGVAKLGVLTQAYKVNGLNFSWHYNSGQYTGVGINSGATFMGTQVIRPPTVTNPDPTQWATYIYYSLELKGTIDLSLTGEVYGNPILSFNESVDPIGDGGPVHVFVPQDLERWKHQTPRQYSLCRAVQSGQLTTLNGYAMPPRPLWPDSPPFQGSLSTRPNQPRRRNPQVLGGRRHTFTIGWTYHFASNTPLPDRFPNSW